MFDDHKVLEEVPGKPGTYHAHCSWRGDQEIGFIMHGERDQVTSVFDAAIRDQYLREVKAFADLMIDRQPEGGPRM